MNTDDLRHSDITAVEVAVLYDLASGEILGSHTLGGAGHISEAARHRFETQLQRQVHSLRRAWGSRWAFTVRPKTPN